MELSFLYSLQALHNPALDKVMIFFTNLGEYGAVWILTAILLLCFQKYRRYGALMLVSLLVTFLIGEIGLKNLIMRERPLVADPTVQQLIPLPSGSSFPSAIQPLPLPLRGFSGKPTGNLAPPDWRWRYALGFPDFTCLSTIQPTCWAEQCWELPAPRVSIS